MSPLFRKLLLLCMLVQLAGGVRLGPVLADTTGAFQSPTMAWGMMPGETLNTLAALFYPADRATQKRFVAVTLKLNRMHYPVSGGTGDGVVIDGGAIDAAAMVFDHSTTIIIPDPQYLTHPGPSHTPKARAGEISSKAISRQISRQASSNEATASVEMSPGMLAQYEAVVSSNTRQKLDLARLNSKLQQLQQTAMAMTAQLEALRAQELKVQQLQSQSQQMQEQEMQAQQIQQQAATDRLAQNTNRVLAQPGERATATVYEQAAASAPVPATTTPQPGLPATEAVAPSAEAGLGVATTKHIDQQQLSAEAREVLPSLEKTDIDAPVVESENAWIKILFPLLLTLAALITLGLMFRWKVNPLSRHNQAVPAAVPPPAFELTSPYKARRRASDLIRPPSQVQTPMQNSVQIPWQTTEEVVATVPLSVQATNEAHNDENYITEQANSKNDVLRELEKEDTSRSELSNAHSVASANLEPEVLADKQIDMYATSSIPPSAQEKPIAYQSQPANSVAPVTEPLQDVAINVAPVRPVAELLAEAEQHIREQKREAALELLENYVDVYPAHSVLPWLQMLNIHHSLRHRKSFNQLVERMHSNFDPQYTEWNDAETGMLVNSRRVNVSHILQELDQLWMDERAIFATEVLKEVVVLQEVLKTRDQFQANQQLTV